jgi:AraC family transcriptional regulator
MGGPATFEWSLMPWLAHPLYREFQQVDDASVLAVEGLALELLAEALRCRVGPAGRIPDWLQRVRAMLHDRFADRLRVAGIARTVGVHPVYLGSLFRRTYGCTVGDYLRRLRVSHASQRLSASDASLAEIALASGFSDQAHFCRSFRRVTGMTPTAYRIAFRGSGAAPRHDRE